MTNSHSRDIIPKTRIASRRFGCATWVHSALRSRRLAFALLIIVGFVASLIPARVGDVAFAQTKKKSTVKPKKPVEPAFVNLINPKTFQTDWHFHPEKTRIGTWKLLVADKDDPVIVCTGKPHGYIRTKKEYKDFELKLEWMYQKKSCNSGILLNIAGKPGKKDKVWPAAIQVQLHQRTVGSIIKTRDSKSKLPKQSKVDTLKLAIAKWHKCTITSRNGVIAVSINGKKVGDEVTDFEPKAGHIGLQSEDWEIRFRRIKIREFKTGAATMAKAKKKTKPKKPELKKKSKTPAS